MWFSDASTACLSHACAPQALKDALAAEKAARSALAGEVTKLKGRASAAEGRRGASASGKENVAV